MCICSGDHTLAAWEHFNTFWFYFKHYVALYCCLGFRFKNAMILHISHSCRAAQKEGEGKGVGQRERERETEQGEEGAQQAAVVLSSFNWTFNDASGKTQRQAETAKGSGTGSGSESGSNLKPKSAHSSRNLKTTTADGKSSDPNSNPNRNPNYWHLRWDEPPQGRVEAIENIMSVEYALFLLFLPLFSTLSHYLSLSVKNKLYDQLLKIVH